MDLIGFVSGLVTGVIVGALVGYAAACLAILRKATLDEWEKSPKDGHDDADR